MAAARPRTAVGKTSPWISQPVPPTPIANDVMKKENPTMTTTVFGMSVRNATPAAASRMNTRHAHVAEDGQRAPADLVDPPEGEVGRDDVDRAEDRRDLDSGDRGADRVVPPALEERRQDRRAVVERDVDPGDLLEDEEDAHDDQRPPHAPGPLGLPLPLPLKPGEFVRRAGAPRLR